MFALRSNGPTIVQPLGFLESLSREAVEALWNVYKDDNDSIFGIDAAKSNEISCGSSRVAYDVSHEIKTIFKNLVEQNKKLEFHYADSQPM